VSQEGALSPIFEGDMPPNKKDPKKWCQYRHHSLNPVNSSPAIRGFRGARYGVFH
jgi:hypothetical protein